jgi:hypothetical protein
MNKLKMDELVTDALALSKQILIKKSDFFEWSQWLMLVTSATWEVDVRVN